MSKQYDLGMGFSFSFFTEKDVDNPTGLIISGPAAPECKYRGHNEQAECAGGVHFQNSKIAEKEGRPRWTVEDTSIENLTLSPSILCGCGGQHGFIRNGRYVKA